MPTETSTAGDTPTQTAAKLVHAARMADDPHAEAARVVTGLFPAGDSYGQLLLAAIEATRGHTLSAATWGAQYRRVDAPRIWVTAATELTRTEAFELAATLRDLPHIANASVVLPPYAP